jgi:hypothetical protein
MGRAVCRNVASSFSLTAWDFSPSQHGQLENANLFITALIIV